MPVYRFQCTDCGPFEARYSMADVPDSASCTCGASARRGVSSPALGRGGSAMALLDSTRSTAETPAVVDRVPAGSRRGTPVSANPLHATLPRP
ncbi:FmdB family zinc ribbon protein [Gordonia hydrophobica]|uniref:FmdB family zinc ribbon protein n=2 Tax=Gordonia hydrophobica TaxID=40516 RepID=A0ABZ2U0L6_9ACTN|nr:FmdB family zinc ribbon protein [Gordonia hydrophobica]MBM7366397.1 putative FmdB family regulatory protein [Gordonia hydrophobica]